MTQHTSLTDLSRRVARLERQNRHLRLVLIALITGGSALLLMGQASAPTTVKARRFVLEDARGRVRGEWRTGGPGEVDLVLNSTSGKPRARIAVQRDHHPRIELRDKSDKVRVAFASFPNGYLGLSLNSAGGRPRASLYVTPDDVPRLSLLDRANRTRATLAVLADNVPHLSLLDARKNTVAALYMDPAGDSRLELFHKLRAAVRLQVADGGERGLTLFGGKGQPLARLAAPAAGPPALKLTGAKGEALFGAP